MTKKQHEDTTIAEFYNCTRARIVRMRESSDNGKNREYIAMCRYYRDIEFQDKKLREHLQIDPRDKIKA